MEDLAKTLADKGLKTAYAREEFLKLFTKVWFRKGQLLLLPGQMSQSLYFLSSGLVRGYRRSEEEEKTTWFAHQGHFLIPDGIFSGAPAREYVEFLEDSEGYALELRQAEKLVGDIPQVAHLFIRLLEDKIQMGKQREEMLRISSAPERYRYLQESYPYVVRQASQEMLASFLHLSPKHLSRVRKEQSKSGS